MVGSLDHTGRSLPPQFDYLISQFVNMGNSTDSNENENENGSVVDKSVMDGSVADGSVMDESVMEESVMDGSVMDGLVESEEQMTVEEGKVIASEPKKRDVWACRFDSLGHF